MEGSFHLAALRTGIGPSVRVGHAEQDLFTVPHRLAVSRGETVEAEARHDSVQPGRELGLAAKLRKAPMSAEERFLGSLFGFGRAPSIRRATPNTRC
jgi:hypothetical protein